MSYKVAFSDAFYFRDRWHLCRAEVLNGFCPRQDRQFSMVANFLYLDPEDEILFLVHAVFRDRTETDQRGGPGFRVGRYNNRTQTAELSEWFYGIPQQIDLGTSVLITRWTLEDGVKEVSVTQWLPYREELLTSSEAK